LSEQLALLPGYLSAHLRLTLAALLAGLLVSVPAGVLVSRVRWLEAPVLGLAGVIQTVPALALLAVMVPLLSGLGLRGIGYLPAFLGLVLYSLLPILRNTVTGLLGLDPAVLEAARAVGLTGGQRLAWVELPLALPVIAAGIRTATVWTVGMATLSTPVGAPSLGNYIFSGLQTRNTAAVLVGCVAAAGLALLLDALLREVVIGLGSRRRPRTALGLAGLVAVGGWALAMRGGSASGSEPPVRVGAKTFTEQYVLAEVLSRLVAAETHRPVTVLSSLGSTVAFDALRRDEIDLYVDYTGTIWATLMGREGAGGGRQAVLGEVRDWLQQRHGIRLVAALGFENAYAFALRRPRAEGLGVRRLGELAPHAPSLVAGSDYEFFTRPEWRAVQSAYGLRFREQRSMDPSLLYAAIARDQVDVITAYSSDGRIAAFDLVTLEDERGAIPPYDAVVLAGPRLARQRPDVLAAVARLEGRLDVGRMRELNRQVDADGRSPAAVAEAFLASGPSARGAAP
jgi:osmoprotectant transport system substrate-binding protein/osmoprotectant transport system permease protein